MKNKYFMKNFENELKNAFKDVKFDNKNQMLSNIYFKTQIKDSIQSVELSLFKKFLIFFNVKTKAFLESFRMQKLQFASFMMLVVIFANLSLPVFLNSTQADFSPLLESNSNFTINRLKNKSQLLSANLLEGDKISTISFSTLKLSEFSEFRSSNDAYFSLDKFSYGIEKIEFEITALIGEYWSNFTSNLNTELIYKINTPICNIDSGKDSVFYLSVTNKFLYVQNFKNDLNVDCSDFNSNKYILKAGDSFKISIADNVDFLSNQLFLLKNLDLDKQLRKSTVDKYLASNDLSLYEINKMLISLKLSNMIEISEFDRFMNQLDIIKLIYNKTVSYGLKDDKDSFDANLDRLKNEIIEFKEDLNNSDLDDLSKTNLYSFFIKWVTSNVDYSLNVLDLEYLLNLKSEFLEVLFVYYSEIIDLSVIENYLVMLNNNLDIINLKYPKSKFSVLKTLYLLKNFVPENKADLNLKIENQINNFTLDTFSSASSTSVLSVDQDSGINLEISSVDEKIFLDSINF